MDTATAPAKAFPDHNALDKMRQYAQMRANLTHILPRDWPHYLACYVSFFRRLKPAVQLSEAIDIQRRCEERYGK